MRFLLWKIRIEPNARREGSYGAAATKGSLVVSAQRGEGVFSRETECREFESLWARHFSQYKRVFSRIERLRARSSFTLVLPSARHFYATAEYRVR